MITLINDFDHPAFKDRLCAQVARIGKALGSPHRLELLAQGERTVEALAAETGLPTANTLQHLQALRDAALVETRKQGLYVRRSSRVRAFARGSHRRREAARRLAD